MKLRHIAFLLTISAGSLLAQKQDLLVGTWKLNLEKSKFDPPRTGPQPQSVMRTFEDRGGGLLIATTETITADGKKELTVAPFKRDGKPYPLATDTGSHTVVMMAFKKVDAHNNTHTTIVNGNVVQNGTEIISADGKTYTEERKGTNPRGQQIDNVFIWERQ